MDSELISNSKTSYIVSKHSQPNLPRKKLSFTPLDTNTFNITFNEGEIKVITDNIPKKNSDSLSGIKKILKKNLIKEPIIEEKTKSNTSLNITKIENENDDNNTENNNNNKVNNKINSIIKNIKEENKQILNKALSKTDDVLDNKSNLERRITGLATYCVPKKNLFRPPPKKTVSSNYLNFNQEEVESLSNMEDITNFYTYTEMCFQLMIEIEKSNIINKCTPLDFPFDDIINSGKKKLAIFDLDETLVHCQAKNIEECQFQINVNLPSNKKGKIGINIRPNWKNALNIIKEKYIIIVFTASHKTYADAVLDFMDPGRSFFPYRLYRNNCTFVKIDGKEIYIKDLSLFKNISLKNIIIIDNSVVSFTYNLNNGMPILPYYDSIKDNELICLAYYLNGIFEYEDLREANKKFVKLEYYKKKAIENLKIEEEEDEDDDEEYNGLKPENKKYSPNEIIENKEKDRNDSNLVHLGTLIIHGSNIDDDSNSNSFKKGVMNYSSELKKNITSLRLLFNQDYKS